MPHGDPSLATNKRVPHCCACVGQLLLEELKMPGGFAFALIQGIAQGHAAEAHGRPVPLCPAHREALEAASAQIRTLERIFLEIRAAGLARSAGN